MKNCFETLVFFGILCSQILQLPVFLAGLLWELELIKAKKFGIYDPCNAPCQKTLQYNCFLRMNQKNV